MTKTFYTTILLSFALLSLIIILPSLSIAGPSTQACKNRCTTENIVQKRYCTRPGSSGIQQCEARADKICQSCLAKCK
jgi:hypothetical protein